MLNVDDIVRHLAAWELVGGPTVPIGIRGRMTPAGLAAAAARHRVTGVALQAVERGALDTPPAELVGQLLMVHHPLLRSSLAAEENMVAVTTVLRDAGLEVRTLKGCATAHLDHDDPALRITSDADLLVPARQLSRAARALGKLVERASSVPDRREGWTDRYNDERTVQLQTGGWIDLHQYIAPGYFGLPIPQDALFAQPDHFTLAGVEIAGLDPTMRLLHAGLHAATANTWMHSQRDVPVMVTRGQADWQRVVELATRWRIEAMLAAGVRQAWSTFGLERHPFADWAASVRATGKQRVAIAIVDRLGVGSPSTTWLALPWRERASYVASIAWPSDEYLAAAGRSRAAHLARPVRKVSGLRRLAR